MPFKYIEKWIDLKAKAVSCLADGVVVSTGEPRDPTYTTHWSAEPTELDVIDKEIANGAIFSVSLTRKEVSRISRRFPVSQGTYCNTRQSVRPVNT